MSAGVLAQNSAVERSSATGTTAPDNSANNDPKRAGGRPTADDQSNSKADIELTQRVRRSIMGDDKLSTYGKNVKIVSAAGKVTLTGVVRTAGEKDQIGMKAAAIAGGQHVVNALEVAPAH